MKRLIAVLPLALLATSCDRQEAPSEGLKQSAEKLVGVEEPEPAPLAAGPYAPRDTCGDLEGADAFRQKLAAAVEGRDADAFLSLAAEDIKLDFGGGSGREELRKRLTGNEWKLWEELDELLTLGCAANKQGGLTIPWYFDQRITQVDPMLGMIVTGEEVPLRSAPEEDAEVLRTISWDVVEIGNLTPDDAYQKVTAASGEEGFVATDMLRSLIDYRLLATRRNGRWSIVSLIAGD